MIMMAMMMMAIIIMIIMIVGKRYTVSEILSHST